MAQASGLLGLAIRFAQRLGVHRDGHLHKLSPWRVEMRRRMWHHILLMDTWCVENEGAESMLFPTSYDTALPQCSNDANWDACEFAVEGPSPSIEFTDMTGALVQYEIASAMRTLLNHTVIYSEIETSLRYQQDLVWQAGKRIDTIYLDNLDTTQPSQKIIKDLKFLAFERMFLLIHQSLFKHGRGGESATPGLQSE
jgi:Fungal specific transcription factor domain